VSKTWFKTSCLERPKSAKNGNKWQDYKYETKPMEWTEDHDLLLMREMMISDLFLY
jgi:hypothetical protein